MPDREDILDRIISARKKDLERLGTSFACTLPLQRQRPVQPFLAVKGAILEIKRASPSRGDIAADLDPAKLVQEYAAAGAQNVSVLTERRFFKGSLEDLLAASRAAPRLSFLRKDFLLLPEEIEVSYRAGADAVLLIARILETDVLLEMAALCRSFGMTPFIEVRDEADLHSLERAAAQGSVAAGVNARDLATFSVDPLIPAGMLHALPAHAVYESGIKQESHAAYAGRLGFYGLLVGEAAAADSNKAPAIVKSFTATQPDTLGLFWRRIAERRLYMNTSKGSNAVPLIKICGLTNSEDVLYCTELGADLLGFVFAESKRTASVELVKKARLEIIKKLALSSRDSKACGLGPAAPLFIGVITELESPLAQSALALARAGYLDAIQWHGSTDAASIAALDKALSDKSGRFYCGRYISMGIGSRGDMEQYRLLLEKGEPRILCDAKVEGRTGGTGKSIDQSLAEDLSRSDHFWLAGGLSPENVYAALERYNCELVDASSRLESSAGKKDHALLKNYFKEIQRYVQR